VSGFLGLMEASSRARVKHAAAREPLAAVRRRALEAPPPPPFQSGPHFGLIAEYKRRSPALGRLAGRGDGHVERVTAYARGGAAAVSVLTEPTRFEGSLGQLADCAAALAPLRVPVMRKDFLVDAYQLHEARAAGAGGALLVVRMLGDASLEELVACARELSLFVLLECFDAGDVARAVRHADCDTVLLGVNCRDLDTLAVEPSRLASLAPLLPARCQSVAESGLATPDDCADAARAGYRLALVGGALMVASDPEAFVRRMLNAGRAAA
jgi:indole-3-glycerol phosphate synthase